MGKRKKRKNSKSFFAGIIGLIQGTLILAAKSLPLLLLIGIGSGIFLGVRQALYADNGLSIQKITVSPSQGISVIQRERLEAQYLGKNILSADLKKISENLQKDPAIQNASVDRRLPSEIFIEIVKRNPIAFIHFANQKKYGVISEDGMILDVVEQQSATGLIIEAPGTSGSGPSIGQFYKSRGFQEIIHFLRGYHQQPMSRQEPIEKVLLDPLGNVSIYLRGGPEIRLGRRPVQRLDAFKKIGPLLESEMRKKIDYLDLQFDDVVVKQKKGVK